MCVCACVSVCVCVCVCVSVCVCDRRGLTETPFLEHMELLLHAGGAGK